MARARAGCDAHRVLEMCLHACERVLPPARGSIGALRIAGKDDLDLLTTWGEEFVADAGLPPGHDQRAIAQRHVAAQAAHFWDVDGRPVSMAIATGATPTGMRIGGVYTPRGLRGQGHASACVAALTQRLLDAGRRRCFLYTDVANPTSNAIYRRLGYVPVADYEEWRFGVG